MASAICTTKFLSRKEVGQQARVMMCVCVSVCTYLCMHASFPLIIVARYPKKVCACPRYPKSAIAREIRSLFDRD